MDEEVEDEKKPNKIRDSIQKVYYLIRLPKGENKINSKKDIIKESIK